MSSGPIYTIVHFHFFQKIPDSLHPPAQKGSYGTLVLPTLRKTRPGTLLYMDDCRWRGGKLSL